MTKSEFDSKMGRAKQKNRAIEYRRELRKERTKYWPKFKLPSTSKIVLLGAALLCVEILFFCQYMIIMTWDANALYAMVGTIVALSSVVLGYFAKSTRENTEGGVVYMKALAQTDTSQLITNDDIEAVG